ncbi:S-layer homology domain-containing protein [Candidatus Peregrinibacteria bacterium]|nr:S-layer homology domain-containing protein [Candidatus Peregrinibacteria bacterium]
MFIYLLILIMNLSTTFASLRKQVAGFSLVTLVAGMLATGVATAATANIFSDVPADAWFAEYVNGLAEMGVVDSTKSMYRPGDLVNRAEMAKFAFMVSGLPKEMATEAPFKDVAMGQWYTDYIYTLSKNGIVSGDKKDGVPTGFFRPTDSLNRAEATKMLVNAAAIAEDLSGAPHFPDVKSSDWFFNFVETAFNGGIVAGYPDGNFRPGNNINRAEAAKMVYLAMNPVATGFTLDSAAAASKTKVELIFSMNVDETSAEMAANYMIEDSSGAKLNVTSAEMVAGDTVHLTTASQTEGKVYYVTAKNVTSEAGEDLANNDEVSFLGYGADVSGDDLSVKMSENSPQAASVPSGATSVVFACWDFKAAGTATVKSLHVHRVGPGKQTDFTNVYLYRGSQRLTTGRSINSETQMIEFNNINQVVTSETMPLCLVGDLVPGATGGVHAFELLSADDVMSNSSNMTGSFPLRGADQLITTAVTGTTTIRKNGSLDEVTVGQKDARIAQFELEADGNEDQILKRIALYVRGSVTVSDIKNLKLYAEGEATALATTPEVGQKDLATFDLGSKGFKIGRGQRKVFYVVAELSPGRDKDNIKTYLDESTDLNVVGSTFGYGTRVTSTTFDGSGTCTSAATCNASLVTIKGSTFNISFKGPTSADVALGQKAARCLDLEITNGSGEAVEIKDWKLKIDVVSGGTGAATAAGLINGAANPVAANFSLIKLAKLNDDGSVGGSVLGPVELSATNEAANDATQTLTLSGSASIAAGETQKYSVVLDVSSTGNDGDKIKCTLNNVATTPDAVRDLNGDALDGTSITPASDVVGNIFTVTASALKFDTASTPTPRTYTRGASNVELAAFTVRSGSSLDNTIKALTINGFVDSNTAGNFSSTGTADFATFGDTADTKLKDVVYSVGLYDGSTLISQIKNVNDDGTIQFNNLTYTVPKSQTKTLVLKGSINNSSPYGVASDRFKFGIGASTNIVALDQNNQTVTSSSIVVANAVTTAANGTIMTVSSGGTGNTTNSASTESKARLLASSTEQVVGRWKFDSTDEDLMLKDLTFLSYDVNSASAVKLYVGGTQVGSVSGYPVESNGAVLIRDLNLLVPDLTPVTLEARAMTNVVGPGGASSGDLVGLALFSSDEVSTSSGANIAGGYNGTGAANGTLLTAMSTGSTSICSDTANGDYAAGQVVRIDDELMVVTAATAAVDCDGVAGNDDQTSVIRPAAASHSIGATVFTMTALAAPNNTFGAAGAAVVNGDVIYSTADAAFCVVTANPAGADNTAARNILTGLACTGTDAQNVVRFVMHGEASVLRKTIPVLSANDIPAGTTLPGTATSIMRFSIAAVGQDQVVFNTGNSITVTGSAFNATIAAAGGGSCSLRSASDSSVEYATATLPAFPAGASTAYTLAFNNFGGAGLQNLIITQGTTAALEVVCNTAGLNTGGGGSKSTFDANITRVNGNIVYDDGNEATNIATDDLLISGLPINGVTITN